VEEKNALSDIDTGIRTYVLRSGRMTDAQRRAIEEIGPKYFVPAVPGRTIDFHAVFGNDRSVVAEIGFGMGRATWLIALDHPQINYLGIEVHAPGVGKLLTEIESRAIANLRIVHHDAVEVLERSVEPSSLAGFHVFYPDPWPKKRHHKRRLIRPGIAELLASRLMPGGYLYFVTDIEDYAAWSLEVLSNTAGFRNRYESYAPRQDWRPETKFESRANRDGRGAWDLLFDKV
jgi:tRNA (guanine-N7-)-methyltransferase